MSKVSEADLEKLLSRAETAQKAAAASAAAAAASEAAATRSAERIASALSGLTVAVQEAADAATGRGAQRRSVALPKVGSLAEIVAFVVTIAVAIALYQHAGVHLALPGWSDESFARVVLAIGLLPVNQLVMRLIWGALHKWFAVAPPLGSENEWPPRVVGAVEAVAYPFLFYYGVPDVATIVAAWIAAKSLGDWKGWQGDGHDQHSGRRRLYIFVTCNALQIGLGVLVAALMACVRK